MKFAYSSKALTHALFYLAHHPEHADTLRKEITRIIEQDGWTKNALHRMWKLDSFLKETSRLNPAGISESARSTVARRF
jgi:cytochrome P450